METREIIWNCERHDRKAWYKIHFINGLQDVFCEQAYREMPKLKYLKKCFYRGERAIILCTDQATIQRIHEATNAVDMVEFVFEYSRH